MYEKLALCAKHFHGKYYSLKDIKEQIRAYGYTSCLSSTMAFIVARSGFFVREEGNLALYFLKKDTHHTFSWQQTKVSSLDLIL
ncbi:MAG: hypothetical protein QXK37_01660 [Candidatus Woesearchaeota archaeon]